MTDAKPSRWKDALRHPYVSHPEGSGRCLKCGRPAPSDFHIKGALDAAPPIAKPEEPGDVWDKAAQALTREHLMRTILSLKASRDKAEARIEVLEKAARAAHARFLGQAVMAKELRDGGAALNIDGFLDVSVRFAAPATCHHPCTNGCASRGEVCNCVCCECSTPVAAQAKEE